MNIFNIQTADRPVGLYHTNRSDMENITEEVQGIFEEWFEQPESDMTSLEDFFKERLPDLNIFPFEDFHNILLR